MDRKELQHRAEMLMADRIIYYFDSKKYADWAVMLLENGYETDNLYILAGLDHERFEIVERYFGLVAGELGMDIDLDDQYLTKAYAVDLSEKVINGIIPPREGLKVMAHLHCADMCDYSEFTLLDDSLDYYENEGYSLHHTIRQDTDTNQLIIDEFKKFLNENGKECEIKQVP